MPPPDHLYNWKTHDWICASYIGCSSTSLSQVKEEFCFQEPLHPVLSHSCCTLQSSPNSDLNSDQKQSANADGAARTALSVESQEAFSLQLSPQGGWAGANQKTSTPGPPVIPEDKEVEVAKLREEVGEQLGTEPTLRRFFLSCTVLFPIFTSQPSSTTSPTLYLNFPLCQRS